MLKSGNARVIAYLYQENVPHMEITGYMARDSWVKANADAARRFKRATDRATAFLIEASKDERDRWVAKYSGAKLEGVAATHLPQFATEFNRHCDPEKLAKPSMSMQ